MNDELQLTKLAAQHGTPLYVYDKAYLTERAQGLFELCQAQGFTARYAVKANPHSEIVKLFDTIGLHFDASSSYEADDLIKQGIKPEKISLSSQQPPDNLRQLLDQGVQFVATSMHQLDLVVKSGWQGDLAVRINPGLGAGHNNRTSTGGPNASFGVWYEYLPQVLDWQKTAGCRINRLHVHVGSGADPKIWGQTIKSALELVHKMPEVEVLDIGGGFKIARMPDEVEADMAAITQLFAQELQAFHKATNRKIKLEVEPGTWLVGNGGMLLAEIIDIVDTGADGFSFIKLNTGMNDFLRPAMYGAQHPITVLNDSPEQQEYLVVGHNCESGDILTPAPGDPEGLRSRLLNKAQIGDLVAISGAGAYAASMRATGYNSFPSASELLV